MQFTNVRTRITTEANWSRQAHLENCKDVQPCRPVSNWLAVTPYGADLGSRQHTFWFGMPPQQQHRHCMANAWLCFCCRYLIAFLIACRVPKSCVNVLLRVWLETRIRSSS